MKKADDLEHRAKRVKMILMDVDGVLTDGKIKDDVLSFNVTLSFQGNDVKFVYKGKVSGDEIQFTRQREGSDRSQEFTAKRVK